MKKLFLLFSLMLCFVFITGCKDKTETTAVVQEEQSITDNQTASTSEKETLTYDDYKGYWKLKVAENENLCLLTALDIYYGETSIDILEINDNLVKGTIYSISGAPSYRQAIVDFEGTIEDGKLITSYEDLGWEYSGTLEITFANKQLVVNIIRDESENSQMWGIPEGEFTFLRPIQTEVVTLSNEEKTELEQFLSPIAGTINPFNQQELTDDIIINFVGLNLSLETIDTSEFGDKINEIDSEVVFDESVMNDLANKYFGVDIKEHKSYEITKYEDGYYSVASLGGVSEYPLVQILMKDTENTSTYYSVVDYIFEPSQGDKTLEYEYLIELEKKDTYLIKSIEEIKYPIDFESLNVLLSE
jgi:hypothetical protein